MAKGVGNRVLQFARSKRLQQCGAGRDGGMMEMRRAARHENDSDGRVLLGDPLGENEAIFSRQDDVDQGEIEEAMVQIGGFLGIGEGDAPVTEMRQEGGQRPCYGDVILYDQNLGGMDGIFHHGAGRSWLFLEQEGIYGELLAYS